MRAPQVIAQTDRPRGTVGLARYIFRGSPPAVAAGIKTDKIADRLNIVLIGEERLFIRSGQRAGIAGTDRVNEDQVRQIQNTVFVRFGADWNSIDLTLLAQGDPFRTEQAHVEPERRASRPAVEGEGHRPVRRALSAVHGIGSEENFILPEIALKGDRTCGRGIVDLLSADLNAVLCFNEVVRELGPGSFAVPQRRAGQQAENQEQGHEFRCEACRSGAVLHVLHPPS